MLLSYKISCVTWSMVLSLTPLWRQNLCQRRAYIRLDGEGSSFGREIFSLKIVPMLYGTILFKYIYVYTGKFMCQCWHSFKELYIYMYINALVTWIWYLQICHREIENLWSVVSSNSFLPKPWNTIGMSEESSSPGWWAWRIPGISSSPGLGLNVQSNKTMVPFCSF